METSKKNVESEAFSFHKRISEGKWYGNDGVGLSQKELHDHDFITKAHENMGSMRSSFTVNKKNQDYCN